MPKEIIWSKDAQLDLINVTDYLINKWSSKIATQFIDILEKYTFQISQTPRMFPIINTNLKIRKCVVTKHNSLYYIEREDKIEIVRMFDNRQNPKRLKFIN